MNSMIGHNRGPLSEIARDDLDEAGRPLATLAKRLAAEPAPDSIVDRDEAGRATERVRNITGAINDIDAAHKLAKAPYLNAARACDAWRDEISRPLTDRKIQLLTALADFQRAEAEAERRRREEEAANARAFAERLTAQADPAAKRAEHLATAIEAHAAAPDAGMSRVRSRTGALASLRSTRNFRIVDATLVPREYLVVDDATVRARMRAGIREIPGIEIFETQTTVVR